MSAGTLIAEGDWAGTPATKGDLALLGADLEGKIKDVRIEVSDLGRDLSGEIAGLRVEIAKQRVSMAWMTVGVIMGLGGLMAFFQFLS